MRAALSLIPELEEVIQHGSRRRRVETLQRITALFVAGARDYTDAHINLFDDVFGLLIDEIETKARAELAHRLAPVSNAPSRVIRTLANDDDIAVAGPVLKLAPRLAESDLVDLARTKGQAHLQAIATREALGKAVTNVLVRRGDHEVVRNVAANRGARISGISAPPDLQVEIGSVLEKVSNEVAARVGPRDYRAAQRTVLGLHRVGGINETALAAFAGDGKYEETVVALAALSKVPISVADRMMASERPDPVLILCKAADMSWPTVKSVITVRPDGNAVSNQDLDSVFANYGRLSAPTAQRVVRFWQVRQAQ